MAIDVNESSRAKANNTCLIWLPTTAPKLPFRPTFASHLQSSWELLAVADVNWIFHVY
jgi:hypothetical protein